MELRIEGLVIVLQRDVESGLDHDPSFHASPSEQRPSEPYVPNKRGHAKIAHLLLVLAQRIPFRSDGLGDGPGIDLALRIEMIAPYVRVDLGEEVGVR